VAALSDKRRIPEVITFHDKQNPATESLLGKYALVESGMHYVSYGGAILVTREMGVSLEGQHLCRTIENGLMIATTIDEDETKTIRRSSVGCVCDTVDEVNTVYEANFASRNMFYAAIDAGKELFAVLNGTEIAPSVSPDARMPNP
jgi:hypothetical protein